MPFLPFRGCTVTAATKACALVYEDDGQRRTFGVPAIAVPELGKHLGEFAADFYHDPSSKLFTVGITGTNGKTTSSHWMSQLFSLLGQKCAAIGTIGCFMDGQSYESAPLTTPDALTMQGLYRKLLKAEAKAVALEASSIGLEQGRLQGTRFDVAVFTNLTRDHLDYHRDMQAYELMKKPRRFSLIGRAFSMQLLTSMMRRVSEWLNVVLIVEFIRLSQACGEPSL